MREQSKVGDVTLIIINKHFNAAVVEEVPKEVKLKMLNRIKGSKFNFIFLITLWAIIWKDKPDAIHCHNDNLIPLLPFFKKRCFLTLHTTGMDTRYLRFYKRVFAISESVAKEIKTRYSGDNISVILNGIDFCSFKKKKEYRVKQSGIIKLIQVSRLVHEIKGQDLLLKAVSELNKRSNDFKFTVDFVGDGPSLPYLETLSQSLSIEKDINFLGYCDSEWVKDHLFQYHILVQPSRIEGFGLTILEGIAAGVPVIASKIDGPDEIMNALPVSWPFTVDDVEDLISQIKAVTDLYVKEKIKEVCFENCEMAQKKFSIKNTALNYLAAYSRRA